jgi:uncharacterized membrane protein
MKIKLTQSWALPPTWLRFLVIVLLILGIFFRFANLGQKVYWHDEVFTSLRLAGYTAEEDLKQHLFNGTVLSVKDLQKYQYPAPETTFMDTVRALIIEDPQHPPLYYALARFWMKLFGNSVATIRSVSALISLLVFPCIYWLCLELFESSPIGWVAIALSALSPVQVVFAQEAREYSLLMVIILLSSASFLRAVRLKRPSAWGIYAASLALGFYSLPLILLTAVGHGVYLIAIEKFRFSKTITAYIVASFAGVLAFAPWLIATFNTLNKAKELTSWSSTRVPFSRLVKGWAGNISRIFFDVNIDAGTPIKYALPVVLIIVALVIYSFYFICRQTPPKVYLFILTMVGVPALSLVLPDLLFGGMRSAVPRYLVPCFLPILLAVAYLIGSQIVSSSFFQQKLWQFIMVFLISGGLVSCVVYSQSEIWWNKKPSISHIQAADIINKTNRPLLVSSFSDANPGELLSLSYLLAPKVRLQLVADKNIPKIPQGFSDIFVFNPSKSLKSGIEREYKYNINPIEPSELLLWKLKR